MTSPYGRVRSLPARHARTRPCYQEPDTETDSDKDRPLQKLGPIRSSQRVRKYHKHNESDEEGVSSASHSKLYGGTTNILSSSRPQRSARKQSHPKHAGIQGQHHPKNVINFKRKKIGHPRAVNVKADSFAVTMPSGSCIVPWQTLEYHILVKILKYAAYPLYSTALRSNTSLPWLVRTSWLCKSFYDAGMSALMYSLPLYPPEIAHSMIRLLNSGTDKLALNYKNRVQFLEIEAKQLLIRKSGINLEQLLRCTPLLSGLRIFHEADELIGKATWADPTWNKEKWSYGHLFDILDKQSILLKSFEWNGRFQDTYDSIPKAHSQPCLRRLEALTIVNVVFSQKQESQRQQVRDNIVAAVDQAKYLSSFTVRNCDIVDAEMMPKLPRSLTSLRIINCIGLTSEALESYLQDFGTSLQDLHLAGNQVMDLGFMANLKELCPNLEQLYIDLSYLDASSYDDRDPLYDELLPNGSPTWPSKICSIVIGPLRSLSVRDAEEFYTSLITSAADLKYLRTLSVKTHLKAGSWRDRAQLRQKWGPLFEKVFLSKRNVLSSISQPKRRFGKSHRRSVRLQELEDMSTSESADDTDENLPAGVPVPLPRQNACNIVEFELSDQRPAREQYAMDDFLDAERSGDEEYS